MGKLYIKNYQIILGVSIFLIGIILFAVLSGPIRYFGIVLFLFAFMYTANILYSKSGKSDEEPFKSRTRDAMLKHQYRK